MSPLKKKIIGIGAVVTLIAPMIPNYVNISISVPIKIEAQISSKKEKHYEIVTKTCKLHNSFVTKEGLKVCDYVCDGSDKQHVYKTYFNNASKCPATITEQVKEKQ